MKTRTEMEEEEEMDLGEMRLGYERDEIWVEEEKVLGFQIT